MATKPCFSSCHLHDAIRISGCLLYAIRHSDEKEKAGIFFKKIIGLTCIKQTHAGPVPLYLHQAKPMQQACRVTCDSIHWQNPKRVANRPVPSLSHAPPTTRQPCARAASIPFPRRARRASARRVNTWFAGRGGTSGGGSVANRA